MANLSENALAFLEANQQFEVLHGWQSDQSQRFQLLDGRIFLFSREEYDALVEQVGEPRWIGS